LLHETTMADNDKTQAITSSRILIILVD